ncbi:MAG TPA: hypothetical protein VMT86_11300 [Bryobacteraceae bacterium]|nr:hypothetical protein [Bryobacteraceae bacterium]
MFRGGTLYVAVLAAAAATLVYQLFIPPVTGLADQGDFVRTICRFGYAPQHRNSLEYFYVEPKYVPDPHSRSPYWEQANSEYLFVGAALLLNKLLSKDGSLDITVAGLVHLLAFLAVFARLLWVTRRGGGHVLLWIAALIVLTDAGYAVYFNSWYAEPASGFFFLLLLAEAIEIGQDGEVTPARLVRWSLWAFLWIFAKPQNAPIGLLLGLFTLRLATWTRAWLPRAVAIAGAVALFGCGIYNVAAMPLYGRMANTYGVIFSGILAESKDPAADLRALGLDPKLAAYAGTGAWSPRTDYPAMVHSGELARVNTFAVLRFYLLRPARMWRRLHNLLPKITLLRPPYGNFEPTAGLPSGAHSRTLTLWTGFHALVLPRVSKWIVFALMAWPLGCAWRWYRAPDTISRRRMELLVLLPLACFGALFSSVYGDAFDFIKHQYLFNLLLDASMLYATVCGWQWLAARRQRTAPSEQRLFAT